MNHSPPGVLHFQILNIFSFSPAHSPAEPPAQTAAQKKSRKSLNSSSDYWPRCGACSSGSGSGSGYGSASLPHAATVASLHAISRQNSLPTPHVSTVAVNVNVIKLDMSEAAPATAPTPAPAATQWTLLCSGSAVDRRQQPTAVIRPRVIPLAASSLVLLRGDCDLQETGVR